MRNILLQKMKLLLPSLALRLKLSGWRCTPRRTLATTRRTSKTVSHKKRRQIKYIQIQKRYELVSDQRTPVLRRGQTFYLAVEAKGGGGTGGSSAAFDLGRDRMKLVFQFGKEEEAFLFCGAKC